MIARFGCRNEIAANHFWMTKVVKTCRMSGKSPENLEHLTKCTEMKPEERD